MGRRRDAPAACSRGGGSPACDVSGVPGLRSAWDLVVDVARGMRKALEWKARGGWVRSGVFGGGGGSVWRCFVGEQRTST